MIYNGLCGLDVGVIVRERVASGGMSPSLSSHVDLTARLGRVLFDCSLMCFRNL